MIFSIIIHLLLAFIIGLIIWNYSDSNRILNRKQKQLNSLRAEITAEKRYYDEMFKDGLNQSTLSDDLETIPLNDTGLLRKNK